MKKIFIVFSCIFSMILFSCASKTVPLTEDVIEPPELIEQETENSEELEIEEEADSGNEELPDDSNTEEIEFSEEDSNIITEIPELEEIIEPVVITLEPEELPVEALEEIETAAEPEQIEVETPPAIEIPEVVETTDEDLTDTSESETEYILSDDSETEESEQEDTDDVVSLDDENAIDITDEKNEDTMDSELITDEIVPSRKVTVKRQEYVDIVYPGSGWVYMGITDGSKDLSYFGRKLGTSDTRFTLQARNPGTKLLHFYRNDALTNQYIDDYIEVEILAEKGSNKTHIEAPAYKQPVPKKVQKLIPAVQAAEESIKESEKNEEPLTLPAESQTKTEKQEQDNLSHQETTPVEEVKTQQYDTDILLKEAKLLYNEKEYKAALEKLDNFFEFATTKKDEGLYLKGQILETKSEVQNIKAAMESYTTLTKNYPASKYWDDANKRIIYLKRFYFGG